MISGSVAARFVHAMHAVARLGAAIPDVNRAMNRGGLLAEQAPSQQAGPLPNADDMARVRQAQLRDSLLDDIFIF